jgi:tubby-related protein 1
MKRAHDEGGTKKGGPRPPPSEDYEVDSDEGDNGFKSDRRGGGASARKGPRKGEDAAIAVVAAPLPSAAGESKVELDLSNMREFISNPVPFGAGVVRCYIERKKSSMRKNAVYVLNLKEKNTFLLAARKRKFAAKSGSSYAISMDVKDINTKSANYVGKVRSNFLGTEFAVYDDGQNPRDIKSGRRETARKQMGICLYASNVLGSRGT